MPNKDNVAQRRIPARRPEKTSPVTQKSQSNEQTKAKQNDKLEKLDLNLTPKKGSQVPSKKPNIDILDVPKVKDNRQFSSRFKISSFRELKQLPSLKEASVTEREGLVIEKLRQACVVFDFTDATSDTKYKEIKKKALEEILEYLSSGSQLNLTDAIYKELIRMVGANIFRTLPPRVTGGTSDVDGDDDEPLYEPSWPHLQIVYEVFQRFLEHPDLSVNVAKQHIDHTFISYVMELFDSEDPRERDYLKTIIHRIYGKMITHRSYIRKQINFFFFKQIYEDENFRGTCELLEILGSIINGFQVPLKEEHKVFLHRVLLPLHKITNLTSFHIPLSYCITEFTKKDKSLLKMVLLDGLLKFWPRTQSIKEIMFLQELEEVMELGSQDVWRTIAKPVSNQIARCVASSHFQVAERALFLWQNGSIQEFMIKNIDIFLPVIFPALCNSKQHWNKMIHGLTYNALKFLMDNNQKLFDECTAKYRKDEKTITESGDQSKRHNDWWSNVERLANKNPVLNTLPSDIQTQVKSMSMNSSEAGSITRRPSGAGTPQTTQQVDSSILSNENKVRVSSKTNKVPMGQRTNMK